MSAHHVLRCTMGTMEEDEETYELTRPSRVPSSLANAGSQWYGDRTSTKPEIETKTWRREEFWALSDSASQLAREKQTTHLQLSLLFPCQVPRILRQTFPSSYKLAVHQPQPYHASPRQTRLTITPPVPARVRVKIYARRLVRIFRRVEVHVKHEWRIVVWRAVRAEDQDAHQVQPVLIRSDQDIFCPSARYRHGEASRLTRERSH